MPSVNLTLSPQGPIIDLIVGVSAPRESALRAENQPVSSPIPCRLLIDTGASSTCVDSAIIRALSLSPSGATAIHTPSTGNNPAICNQYDVKLIIPHTSLSRVFPAIPVVESDFSSQGIQGLLGRDVLASCVLFYNGEIGLCTLSF